MYSLKEKLVEDSTHLLTHYTAQKKERKEILKITAKISIDFGLVKIEENMPVSDWKPLDLVYASSKFISAFPKKRQIAIENVYKEI